MFCLFNANDFSCVHFFLLKCYRKCGLRHFLLLCKVRSNKIHTHIDMYMCINYFVFRIKFHHFVFRLDLSSEQTVYEKYLLSCFN